MPNWCSNSLHFEGNPERIAEVAEQILIKTDDGYQFSFQHIVPMPEELILPEVPDSYMQLTWLQIAQQPEKKLINLEQEMLEQRDKSSWSVRYRLPDELFSELKQYFSEKFDWDNLTVGEVFTHFEDNAEVASRFRYDQQFAKRIAENIRQYGHKDWYDWRMANWGCKWDVDPDCTFVTVGKSDILTLSLKPNTWRRECGLRDLMKVMKARYSSILAKKMKCEPSRLSISVVSTTRMKIPNSYHNL